MTRTIKHCISYTLAISIIIGFLSSKEFALAQAESVLTAPEAFQVVTLQNVKVQGNVVSGEIINRSAQPLRDVQLLIRGLWQWKDEFRPGENPPGFAEYYTINKPLAPGGSMRFTYRLASQLPSRPDGDFETVVSLAGFTEIIQSSADRRVNQGLSSVASGHR